MDIPKDVKAALKKFKAKHGRTWKSQLSEAWLVGDDQMDQALRQARNVFGPSGLYRLRAKDLA